MVPLVSWALVGCKASRETAARLARWVSKAFLAFPDPSVPWASKVHSVPKVSPVLLAFVASKERMVLSVCVAHLAPQAPPVPSVFVARLVRLVWKASRAPVVSRATQVLRESRETLAPLDRRVLPAWLDNLARTERMESLAQRVSVVTAAHKVSVVLPVLLALKVSREARVLRGVLVLVDSKVSKDQRETLATVAQKVPVAVVPLDLKDLKASKAPRESVVHLALVPVAPLVQWGPRESVVKWASKVPRVTLAPLVLKASADATVSRVTRGHRAPWAAQAFVDPRATVVSKVPRATLVSKAPRETRVMSASVVQVAPLAWVVLLVLRELLASVVQSVPLAVVVSRERLVPLARWGLVDPRVTEATVACVDPKVFEARRVTPVLVALVETKESRVLVV